MVSKRQKLVFDRSSGRKVSLHRAKSSLRLFFAEEIHQCGLDVDDFVIYLEPVPTELHAGEGVADEPGVEYQMSAKFIKNLHILTRKDPKRPVLVHMKTNGGEWEEGMAIYDSIRACPNPVTILSHTHARSMSSIIPQAADKRVLMPNSYFLIHEGFLGVEGNYKGVVSGVKYAEYTREVMLDIYVDVLKNRGEKFSGWSVDRIRKMLIDEMDRKEDVYLTAQQAVDWGFADEVFGADGNFDWTSLRKY